MALFFSFFMYYFRVFLKFCFEHLFFKLSAPRHETTINANAPDLTSMDLNMRGIINLDFLSLKEIFKLLTPLDLCSIRQSCTQLREYIDDYCRSHYFAREQWLDLRGENIRNVKIILNNFGKFVRRLKVGNWTIDPKLLLDTIETNCRDNLKGLSLKNVHFQDMDMEPFGELCNNLDILELNDCHCNNKKFENFLGRQYPSLTTLILRYSNVGRESLKKFFTRPRKIKKLNYNNIDRDILDFIAQNGAEIEELGIVAVNDLNLILVTELSKLKRLKINCDRRIVAVVTVLKELSVNNELEMLGLYTLTFTDELCNAISNLTNLKELRFRFARFTGNVTILIDLLCQKLLKLESLMLVSCYNFPYRKFLASACKSNKLRTIYVSSYNSDINNFIQRMVKDFNDGIGSRCFVSGNPLHIYLPGFYFDKMEGLLTQGNLQSIEKYRNIKIRRASDEVELQDFFDEF